MSQDGADDEIPQEGRNLSKPRSITTPRMSSASEISSPDSRSHYDAMSTRTSSQTSRLVERYSTADDAMPSPSILVATRVPLQSYSADDITCSREQSDPDQKSRVQTSRFHPRLGGKIKIGLSILLPRQSSVGTPTSASPKNFSPILKDAQSTCSPVSMDTPRFSEAPLKKTPSKRYPTSRKSLLGSKRPGSIQEEEIDMTLLESAMPMGTSDKPVVATVEEVDSDEQPAEVGRPEPSPMVPGFDLSTYSGAIGPDEAQLKEIHRREAAGMLTGGLGQGLKPDATIKSTDLFSQQPPPTPTSGRVTMKSVRSTRSGKTATLKSLGQSEANKRGEIIEVVMDPMPFDLSSFAGDDNNNSSMDFIKGAPTRQGTFQTAKTEVFYPQANWKPFWMRWPYLCTLVVISLVLAASQEYLCQKYAPGKEALFVFRSSDDLKTWDYFSFKYLPTGIAVFFGVLWQLTDFEVKRLEAYYQLSKEGGALAAESLNVDYITFFSYLRPIQALQVKHYAVAISSIATLLAVSLVPILQAASVVLSPSREQRERFPYTPKQIHIAPVYSRLLTTLLLLIAILGFSLLWQLQRRRSGLVADVKGIAGIAAMANRSHILMDFKNMDTATHESIHQTLKTHRYSLRNSSLAPEGLSLTQADKDKYDQQKRTDNPHPLMLRLIAGIPFIIGMALFLGLIPIVLFTPANALTDKAPWLLTLAAVSIKLAWGTLETSVRMIEPYYRLSKRHASPRVLTLDYTSMAFGWMPIRAFLNGHILVGCVGLGSVFAEVLTVCVTSFSTVAGNDFTSSAKLRARTPQPINSGEETFNSFWVSFSLAMCILSYLCFFGSLVYFRRRHPFLPRQPSTIASVLAFIHQSKMLYDFVGTEKMSSEEMVRKLVRIGKKYGLGWFTGRDGERHCGVDEEELLGSYEHGLNVRDAVLLWAPNWQTN